MNVGSLSWRAPRVRETTTLRKAWFGLLFCVVVVGLSVAPSTKGTAYARSERIALVPNSTGDENHGGTLPTTGFPNSYAPTFTNVAVATLQNPASSPLLDNYDTVVLNSICRIGTLLADATFRSKIESFVTGGGKLVIWDSECVSTNYSAFAIPFQTSNPGQLGAQGTLVDVEENALSSSSPSSPSYVNVNAVASGTDAVGDGNVFTTSDPRWLVDLRATNAVGVNGPVQAYAHLGSGLIIYSGLDKDFLPGTSFDPASTSGTTHLARIWLLELLQPWSPDGLPATLPATWPSIPIEQTYGPCDSSSDLAAKYIACQADPVSGPSGAFVNEAADVTLPGVGIPFSFTRSYTSADATVGPLGPGWTHSLSISLQINGAGAAVVRAGSGQQLVYPAGPSGTFVDPPAARASLKAVAGGYELLRRDLVKYSFNSSGQLTSIEDRNGNGLSLNYLGGVLSDVSDADGQTATFEYTAGRLTRITFEGDSRSLSYAYESGRLRFATDLRGKTTEYRYDATGRLSDIIDPLGNTVVHNVYGADGRVTRQADPLGNESTFSFDAVTKRSTMVDARGNTWIDEYLGNILKSRTDAESGKTQFVYDPKANPSALIDARGSRWEPTYDAQGNLVEKVDPLGATSTFTYGEGNLLTSATDELDRTTTYDYDAAGNLIEVVEPNGATTTITPGPVTGLPTSVTDARGKTWTYGYDAAGHQTQATSPLGLKTTMTYDARGFMTSRTDPRGNEPGASPAAFTTTYTYDDAGHVLTETDPLGGVTTMVYDAAGRLTSQTDARGKTTAYSYNAAGEVTTVTAPDGGETTTTYDASGNLLTETDAEGGVTSYVYDGAGRTTEVTDPRGKTSTSTYDAGGKVLSETSPLGNTTSYTYDALGRRATRTSPRGNDTPGPGDFTTTFMYDAVGNMTSETDPLGNTTTTTYDHQGRVLTRTDEGGKTTTFTYDAAGNLLTQADPLGNTTTSTYDDDGRLSATTDPRGKTTTDQYDAAGNRTTTTTPKGNRTTMTYDALSRLASRTDPRGNVTGATPSDFTSEYTYDPASHLLTEIDALDKTTTYTYDDAGYRKTKTDALNRTTTYTYDLLGRMTSLFAPDAALTSFAYDASGNLTSRTDANGHTATLTYDDDGRKTSEQTPLGNARSFGYDADGNLTSEVDPRGNATSAAGDFTIARSYDANDRLTGIDYSDITPDVTYSYDSRGRRTQMSDGAGTETRAYDDAGRLLAVTRATKTLSYQYDSAGNITRRTYPSGTTVDRTYDADGLLASVAGPGGTATYAYDPSGHELEVVRPNGTNTQWVYDRVGRPIQVRHLVGTTNMGFYRYTYDGVGNPIQVETPEGDRTYRYDAQDRLTERCIIQACTITNPLWLRYTYDKIGNRLTQRDVTGTTTYSYDADDRLLGSTDAVGTTTYAHDAAGNMTNAHGPVVNRLFAYDLPGRMTTLREGEDAAPHRYTYDGDGKRLTARHLALLNRYDSSFAWDVTTDVPELVEERDSANDVDRSYVHGNELLSVTTAAATSWYHTDALGSVGSITDALGSKDWSYAYEPFGGESPQTLHRDPLAPEQPLRFTGQYLDATGFYHMRARQYDAGLGRFMARDPVSPAFGDPSSSTYAYAVNRPTVFVDPTGLRGQHYIADLGLADWVLGTSNTESETGTKPTYCAVGGGHGCGPGTRTIGSATKLECREYTLTTYYYGQDRNGLRQLGEIENFFKVCLGENKRSSFIYMRTRVLSGRDILVTHWWNCVDRGGWDSECNRASGSWPSETDDSWGYTFDTKNKWGGHTQDSVYQWEYTLSFKYEFNNAIWEWYIDHVESPEIVCRRDRACFFRGGFA